MLLIPINIIAELFWSVSTGPAICLFKLPLC